MSLPFRQSLLVAAGSLALPGFVMTARATDRKPVLRVAHITDVHVTKDRNAS